MLDFLNNKDFIIFTTADFAKHERLSMSAASGKLSRLERKRTLTRITRGIWANSGHPYFHPLSCVPYLLGKEHGYVSFLTALHLHGLVSQIPATIQVATTGHTRKLTTDYGIFDFIQVKPELMREGVDWSDAYLPFLQASPEKALIDVLYIATRKGNRFSKLPELEFTKANFNKRKFDILMKSLPLSKRIVNAMMDGSKIKGVRVT